jgi:thiol-disulfide isomerase/thioredoxin
MDRYAEHPLSATPISRCLFLLFTIAMAGSTLHRATSAELDRAGRIAPLAQPATGPSSTPAAATAPRLKVGDPAPPLQVDRWLQGKPVERLQPGTVYLIEFWASWCGPCLTSVPHVNALHRAFEDKGLVAIAQNVWEQDEGQAEAFVQMMGHRMTYRVALDDKRNVPGGAMAADWLAAAERKGLPAAFLVDRKGRIAWIGHPMAIEDEMIEDLLR